MYLQGRVSAVGDRFLRGAICLLLADNVLDEVARSDALTTLLLCQGDIDMRQAKIKARLDAIRFRFAI